MSDILFGIANNDDSQDESITEEQVEKTNEPSTSTEEPQSVLLQSEQVTHSPAVERVKMQARSVLVLHKLHLARDLVDHARLMGYEDTITHLIPIINTLINDNEVSIKQEIVHQIPELSKYLKEYQNGYDVIIKQCLPILPILLKDSASQVRETAAASLLEFPTFLTAEDIKKEILPIVDDLANGDEDGKVQACEILNDLAPHMDQELVLKYTIPLFKELSQDTAFRVRKAAASCMNLISEKIGTENTINLLLPIYFDLSKDDIWGVRKACGDSLVAISKMVNDKIRMEKLVPLYQTLLEDKSRWVKSAAHESLGPFIATFTKSVPDFLLDSYCKLAKPEVVEGTETPETEEETLCAFNFPAVLKTIGPEQWPRISDTFITLTKSLNWKVRRTLSFSLHIVAEILGQKLTEQCLLSTFELFMQDLDEVKQGVMKNFAAFLKVLSPETRKTYSNVLDKVQTQKWRFRRTIAKQLGDLAEVFDADTVQNELLPFALKVLHDPTSSVRSAVIPSLFKIVKIIIKYWDEPENFLEEISKLSSAKKNSASKRVIFTKIVLSMVDLDQEIFDNYFLCPLVYLADDKVANVRMFTAKALQELKSIEKFKNDERISEALEKLRLDKDRDVIASAGGTPPPLVRKKKIPVATEKKENTSQESPNPTDQQNLSDDQNTTPNDGQSMNSESPNNTVSVDNNEQKVESEKHTENTNDHSNKSDNNPQSSVELTEPKKQEVNIDSEQNHSPSDNKNKSENVIQHSENSENITQHNDESEKKANENVAQHSVDGKKTNENVAQNSEESEKKTNENVAQHSEDEKKTSENVSQHHSEESEKKITQHSEVGEKKSSENVAQHSEDEKKTGENVTQHSEDEKKTNESIVHHSKDEKKSSENIPQHSVDEKKTDENVTQHSEDEKKTSENVLQHSEETAQKENNNNENTPQHNEEKKTKELLSEPHNNSENNSECCDQKTQKNEQHSEQTSRSEVTNTQENAQH